MLTTGAVLAVMLIVNPGSAYAIASSVGLGTAESFAVLGGQSVTNTGPTVLNGDLAVSPGTAITGFPPGIDNGAIHAADAAAAQAQTDLTVAYNNAAGQASDNTLSGQDLGGLTLLPGVHTFASSAGLTGTLTLDAQGDPNAVFIFQVGSTLTTASASSVALINGAAGCNVFWQVGSSATLGTNTTFVGSIMALTSVTVTTGTTISGRALARNGSVALDTNTITASACDPVATAPDAPTALTADPADRSAHLTFLPPADNGGSDITGYEVSIDDGDTWDDLTTTPGTGDVLKATVTELTNGVPYEIRVRARNTVDAGDESGSKTVTPLQTAPGAPTGVTATAGNGGAELVFTPPLDNGGAPITGYEVSTDGTNWNPLSTTPGTGDTRRAVMGGLANGTNYLLRVRAANLIGPGPASAGAPVTPQAKVPEVPTALTAVAAAGAAGLTFTPPMNSGGSPIIGYDVSTDGGVTWLALASAPGAGNTVTGRVTGLVNGTEYTVAVRARNSIGPGAAGNMVTVTVAVPPGAPTGLTAVPGNGSAVLTFTPPSETGGSAITGYDVSSDNGATWAALATTAGTGGTRTGALTGLANGTTYQVTVRATTIRGAGAPSGGSTVVPAGTLLAAPTALAATPGNGSADLVFVAPPDSGDPITGYEVSTDGGSTWASLTTSGAGDTRRATVNGLDNGSTYQMRVRALNAAGNGAASGTVPVTPAATVPGPPTDLTAQSAGDGVTVWFIRPVDTGGSEITGYQVSTDDGATWAALGTDTATDGNRTATVTGLDDGASYTLRVRAVNAAGAGEPSDSATATAGIPRAPTAVTATAGTSSIVVTWDAPGGGNVTRYTAVADPGPATCTTTGELTCVLGGVAGTGYTVTVITTVGGADSAPSQPSDRVVPTEPVVTEAPPETPLVLTTDQGDISTAEPGEEIIVIGTGFAASSTVTLTLYSEPIVLDSVVTDADGSFSVAVTIPAGAPVGDHTIVASGVDPDGDVHTMKLEFDVEPAVAVVVPPAPAPGGGTLPLTGTPLTGIVLAGLGAILAGALLCLAGLPYRRRPGTAPAQRLAATAGP